MNANLGKAAFIAILLVGFAGIYFRTPLGDRWFALGVWLVFSIVAGCCVLLMPVLHCPCCGRATMYFDNYSDRVDRLTGGHRRHVKCKRCHSFIDRLDGTVVLQLPIPEGQKIDRLGFLLKLWLVFVQAGCAIVFASTVVGVLVVLTILNGRANNQRIGVVLLSWCGVFTLGLLLIATGWYQRRRAKRFADQQHIKLSNRIRIRW